MGDTRAPTNLPYRLAPGLSPDGCNVAPEQTSLTLNDAELQASRAAFPDLADHVHLTIATIVRAARGCAP
jgi:hypothetical protein